MFTAAEKMSKKQRRELNKSKRVQWGFCPVSRIKPSAKVYNRKKVKYAVGD